MPTLDCDERQVLVDYPNDPNLQWHHRLLLVPLGGGRWICSTPDLAIQPINLNDHRVIILQRNAAFPADRAAQTYAFDPADVDAATLARLRADAQALAQVLGDGPPAGAAGPAPGAVVWRISDTSSSLFGDEVPAVAVANNAVFVHRGDAKALVQVDNEWYFAAREDPAKPGLAEFRKRFHSGDGRDPRILGMHTDSQGRRFLGLEMATSLLQCFAWDHRPVDGPRTVKDFLHRMRSAGYAGFLAYHADWV